MSSGVPEIKGQPVASLPMYDWPEVHWANDVLWTAIAAGLAARGIEAPQELDRTRSFDNVWLDPKLVLSQTCGYPFSTRLIGRVNLVGTPHYRVEGCYGPYYSTMLVVRKDTPATSGSHFQGTRAAFNSRDSMSGFVALQSSLRSNRFGSQPEEWIETGGHRASITAVAESRADIASIDAVCWDLAKRFEPAASELKVISQTPMRPGLPFVTAQSRSQEYLKALRDVLTEVLQSADLYHALDQLRLGGFSLVDTVDYRLLATTGAGADPKPVVLPHDASDEAIFGLVREWCEALASEDYIRAYFMTRHRWDMTPWLMRTLVECFGWVEPLNDGRIFKVTSPATAKVRSGEEAVPASNRWHIYRRSEPLTNDPEFIGHVDYDLPLNGFWSHLTAQFTLLRSDDGLVLEFDSIHVL